MPVHIIRDAKGIPVSGIRHSSPEDGGTDCVALHAEIIALHPEIIEMTEAEAASALLSLAGMAVCKNLGAYRTEGDPRFTKRCSKCWGGYEREERSTALSGGKWRGLTAAVHAAAALDVGTAAQRSALKRAAKGKGIDIDALASAGRERAAGIES